MLDEMSLIFGDNSSTLDELSQMLDELSKVTFGASCHSGRVVTLDELSGLACIPCAQIYSIVHVLDMCVLSKRPIFTVYGYAPAPSKIHLSVGMFIFKSQFS